MKVLDGVEVKFPDRSIFYQRVEPPVAARLQAAAPAQVVVPLSPAEQAAVGARARKKFGVLMLSATVYDHAVTELRWFSGGKDIRAWSNVDFNHLAGLGEIETADTIWLLLMGLGNDTRESVAEWNRFAPEWERFAAEQGLAERWEIKAVPELAKFPTGRSSYLLAGETGADESLTALDALHRYYDAHRLRLVAAYEQRLAGHLARKQWLKSHPPVPKDTVIRFWPKKSRNYPTSAP